MAREHIEMGEGAGAYVGAAGWSLASSDTVWLREDLVE
jgi:hypothetical protein